MNGGGREIRRARRHGVAALWILALAVTPLAAAQTPEAAPIPTPAFGETELEFVGARSWVLVELPDDGLARHLFVQRAVLIAPGGAEIADPPRPCPGTPEFEDISCYRLTIPRSSLLDEITAPVPVEIRLLPAVPGALASPLLAPDGVAVGDETVPVSECGAEVPENRVGCLRLELPASSLSGDEDPVRVDLTLAEPLAGDPFARTLRSRVGFVTDENGGAIATSVSFDVADSDAPVSYVSFLAEPGSFEVAATYTLTLLDGSTLRFTLCRSFDRERQSCAPANSARTIQRRLGDRGLEGVLELAGTRDGADFRAEGNILRVTDTFRGRFELTGTVGRLEGLAPVVTEASGEIGIDILGIYQGGTVPLVSPEFDTDALPFLTGDGTIPAYYPLKAEVRIGLTVADDFETVRAPLRVAAAAGLPLLDGLTRELQDLVGTTDRNVPPLVIGARLTTELSLRERGLFPEPPAPTRFGVELVYRLPLFSLADLELRGQTVVPLNEVFAEGRFQPRLGGSVAATIYFDAQRRNALTLILGSGTEPALFGDGPVIEVRYSTRLLALLGLEER